MERVIIDTDLGLDVDEACAILDEKGVEVCTDAYFNQFKRLLIEGQKNKFILLTLSFLVLEARIKN